MVKVSLSTQADDADLIHYLISPGGAPFYLGALCSEGAEWRLILPGMDAVILSPGSGATVNIKVPEGNGPATIKVSR